jgi:hypothetical protein
MTEEQTLQLAEDIVSAQGATFIREFLRTFKYAGSKVFVGTTKVEALQHLKDAIRARLVSFEDLMEWLKKVEGWGAQHIYLYRPSRRLTESAFLRSEEAFIGYVRSKGLSIVQENKRIMEFTEAVRLGRIGYSDGRVDIIWRKGTAQWQRDSTRDYDDSVGDDLYRFRAWRQTPERSVVRFQLFTAQRKAALFVQIPLGPEHMEVIKSCWITLAKLFPLGELTRIPVAQSINLLDTATQTIVGQRLPNNAGAMLPQATRFRAYGAFVEFGADDNSYVESQPVRRVRNAVRVSDFDGGHATFRIHLRGGPGLDRVVRMSLNGDEDRLYLFSQMSEGEVWDVLDHVLDPSGAA